MAEPTDSPTDLVNADAISHLEPRVAGHLLSAAKTTQSILAKAVDGDKDWNNAWINLGSQMHAHELLELALQCYAKPLSQNPDHSIANYLSGQAQMANSENPDALGLAVNHFRRALATEPSNATFSVALGMALEDSGHMNEAHLQFSNANKFRPDDAFQIAKLGKHALLHEDFDLAIQFYLRALALEPGANQLHYPVAQAYRRIGALEIAREHARKAGSMQPTLTDPYMLAVARMASGSARHLLAGIKLAELGKLQAAKNAFLMALDAEPENTKATTNLAITLAALGENTEALKQFKKALRGDPNNYLARYNFAMLLVLQDNDMKAQRHLERAVELKPGYLAARLALGHVHMRAGRPQASAVQYHAIVNESPRDAVAHYWLGMAFLAQMKNAPALEHLDRAQSMAPRQVAISNAFCRAASVSLSASKTQRLRARALAQHLYRQRPFFVYGESLAMILVSSGDTSNGIKLLEELIRSSEAKNKLVLSSRLRLRLELAQTGVPDQMAWPTGDDVFKPASRPTRLRK